jgi:prevent-host-death family protein
LPIQFFTNQQSDEACRSCRSLFHSSLFNKADRFRGGPQGVRQEPPIDQRRLVTSPSFERRWSGRSAIDRERHFPVQLNVQRGEFAVKQLSLTEARAKLSRLVAEVDKGNGPIAIAQRSKVKALLVDPERHGRMEEELAHYRSRSRQSPLKLRGSMTLTGDLDEALQDLKREREQSLQGVIAALK